MNHRNIPLGYALSGGNIIINEAEADTVREIAEQYLSGKSLKAIAELLTAKHIEYMSGKTDWNRSRIKRIVEDKRYIGDGGYLPILTEQEYMRQTHSQKSTHYLPKMSKWCWMNWKLMTRPTRVICWDSSAALTMCSLLPSWMQKAKRYKISVPSTKINMIIFRDISIGK